VRRVFSSAIVLLAFGAKNVQARHHSNHADSDAQAGQFDYYVLSLSWAPTYCLTHMGDGAECGGACLPDEGSRPAIVWARCSHDVPAERGHGPGVTLTGRAGLLRLAGVGE
jgi:hypothetical protein